MVCNIDMIQTGEHVNGRWRCVQRGRGRQGRKLDPAHVQYRSNGSPGHPYISTAADSRTYLTDTMHHGRYLQQFPLQYPNKEAPQYVAVCACLLFTQICFHYVYLKKKFHSPTIIKSHVFKPKHKSFIVLRLSNFKHLTNRITTVIWNLWTSNVVRICF